MSTEVATKPLRADARRNRERVLAAAREAFAEHGVDLPMEDLARRAGVGVGTVYRHFPSKEALLDALVISHMTEIVANTQAALDRDDPWDAFCDCIRFSAERQAVDSSFCEAMFARKRGSTDPQLLRVKDDLESNTQQLIRRAQDAGDMRADFSADDVPMFFTTLSGAIRAAHDHPEFDWRRQLEFLLDGLRAPA